MMQAPLAFARDGRSRSLLPAGALLIALVGFAPSGTGAQVSPEILANQAAKIRQAERLASRGKELPPAEHLEWESAVLYVAERLTSAEKALLEADGIVVNRDVWVPPVPGLHPHGFHLARVRYDALAKAAAHQQIVRIGSAEAKSFPTNDVTRGLTAVEGVHEGASAGPYRGAGVLAAVADSGLDISHPDIPLPVEAYDITTGDTVDEWSTDVSNKVTGHGTHVTGTLLGRGTLSGGSYAGMAPEADLLFYKIGNDENAATNEEQMVKAVVRASSQGAHVFSLSYGGFGPFMDGTAPTSQAMDAAHAAGMNVVVAAGNSATTNRHYSLELAPNASHDPIRLTLSAPSSEPFEDEVVFRVIWRDDDPEDANVTMELLNPGDGELFELESFETSIRNTEMARYFLVPVLGAGDSKTYDFRLSNGATGGETPLVHVYQASTSRGTFQGGDSSYTITRPADTSSALAVAAYVHRNSWVDFNGSNRSTSQPLGQRATFSSIGPRVDGEQKPDVLAPGSYTISTMDSDRPSSSSTRISNDGVNDGSGPANYSASQGTSMAAPAVAGALALLREANPELTAEEARTFLLQSGVQSDSPDFLVGVGLLDIEAAIDAALEPLRVESWLMY